MLRVSICFVLLAVYFVVTTTAECANDPNAEVGCDDTCSRRCSASVTCPGNNCEPKCRCMQGFKYDFKAGKCVEPSNCSN